MSDYKVTIGLEIHAELKTRTKMFCNSKNDPDEKSPNVNVCPVCMGYPGTLPTVNFDAVKKVIQVGVALGGVIADYTEFDRKNYFYPDIPKGYQISQYAFPLVTGGELSGVKLTRIHLEEDTARSTHDAGDYSLIDFNRAGIPLMELVTEPVIHSADEAGRFAKEFQLLLQTMGVGDANMEKGEMRVEANISVSKTKDFGTKVEVKNLNSFRSVERAVAHEVERHIKALEAGERVVQETRGWDEGNETTFSQRAKEDSHDYRYFPDPDIPKIIISEIPELNPEKVRAELPELPWEKRSRLIGKGLKPEDVEFFVNNLNWATYLDLISSELDGLDGIKIVVNYLTSDLAGLVKNDSTADFSSVSLESTISPINFVGLTNMILNGEVSSRGAKDILKIMYEGGESQWKIAKENALIQKSDEGELKKIAELIIAENPGIVADYKGGKVSVIQFFVGQGMKVTKGAGNPAVLKKIFEGLLS